MLHGEAVAEGGNPREIPLDMSQLDAMAEVERSRVFDVRAFMWWATSNFTCWYAKLVWCEPHSMLGRYFVMLALMTFAAWVCKYIDDKGIFAFCFLMIDYFRCFRFRKKRNDCLWFLGAKKE